MFYDNSRELIYLYCNILIILYQSTTLLKDKKRIIVYSIFNFYFKFKIIKNETKDKSNN